MVAVKEKEMPEDLEVKMQEIADELGVTDLDGEERHKAIMEALGLLIDTAVSEGFTGPWHYLKT